MAVEIKVPTVMQKLTGGAKTLEGQGSTLRDLFRNLDRQFPGIQQQIADDSGEMHRFVNVYVNDEDVRFLGKLDTSLSDGDVVQILPALAGGAAAGYISAGRSGDSR